MRMTVVVPVMKTIMLMTNYDDADAATTGGDADRMVMPMLRLMLMMILVTMTMTMLTMMRAFRRAARG